MRHIAITRAGAAGFAAASLLLLAACSDDPEETGSASGSSTEETTGGGTEETTGGETEETTATGGEGGGEGATIEIEGFAYSEASAAAGATVAVNNADGATHTVTSEDDAWEEASVDGGGSGEFTAPSEAGEYPYFCRIHPNMTGTLVVE